MKSLPFFVFNLSLLFVFSCEKDNSQELILGKWKYVSSELKDCDNPFSDEKKVYDNGCYYKSGYTVCEDITFNADKSFIYMSTSKLDGSAETGTYTNEGVYMIDGNKLTVCSGTNNNNCSSGTFSVSETSLKVNSIIFDNCSSEIIYKK